MLLKLAALCVVFVTSWAEVVVVELTTEIQEAFLAEHNAARTAVGVGPLTWDKTLSDFAAANGSACIFKHSRGPYGENLFASSPRSIDHVAIAGYAVKAWVSEIKNADPPAWTCVTNSAATCGHYSQVVWAKTLNVGCAIIHCDIAPRVYGNHVFCEYFPRGNYIGKAPYV